MEIIAERGGISRDIVENEFYTTTTDLIISVLESGSRAPDTALDFAIACGKVKHPINNFAAKDAYILCPCRAQPPSQRSLASGSRKDFSRCVH